MEAIAAASQGGSTFLLWEREAHYSGSTDARQHTERVCGVTYMKTDEAGKAAVIATFRQPSQVCMHAPVLMQRSCH